MDDETMETTLLAAQANYEKDRLFRQFVDAAVAEAMKHFEHVPTEAQQRDIHFAAVIAARTALRLAMDGDPMLKMMEFERDAAKKHMMNMAKTAPMQFITELKD
ncbi:MAG: hypothetical protein AAGF82_05325 [Pseudomonadota bacterium]